MNYFIEVAYKGSAFHGWQIQPNALSVQEVLQDRMGKLLRQPVELVGSGRTDTGVHCLQQFACFQIEKLPFPAHDFLHKINSFLPAEVAINSICEVNPTAHARFDASKRSYLYKAHLGKNPFLQGLSWELRAAPDLEAMNEAARSLLGTHDFAMFCKAKSQNFTTNCKIMEARWEQTENRFHFLISANRFLRGMVRFVVGHLMAVGTGQLTSAEFTDLIANAQRSKKVSLAPAHGLYLYRVEYPESVFIGPKGEA